MPPREGASRVELGLVLSKSAWEKQGCIHRRESGPSPVDLQSSDPVCTCKYNTDPEGTAAVVVYSPSLAAVDRQSQIHKRQVVEELSRSHRKN